MRSRDSRLRRHAAVSAALALLSDRELDERVRASTPLGSGIGGHTRSMQVTGAPVFVKLVALTDLERRPEHVRSTANVFGLPTWSHYGVGSAGGGVWRELAAHQLTSDWVLDGRSENFPLLHHWRVLPRPGPRAPTPERRREIDTAVDFWHGCPAVRRRLEAIATASADVLLFLEHVPHTVLRWLDGQVTAGPRAADDACAMLEGQLLAVASALESGRLLHFDAHFGNLLTDGQRLYLTDFGLASSPLFDVTEAEGRFLDEHVEHDRCYLTTQLVNWIATRLAGVGRDRPAERNAFVRRCAAGHAAAGLPPSAAAIVRRYAPVAVPMNDFYYALHSRSRQTPYPRREILRACAATGWSALRPGLRESGPARSRPPADAG